MPKAFWLSNAHILEEHYKGRPSGWTALLAHYRGDVTHHGYLDILEAWHDTQEIADVAFHLHDALARVILKILRFDGGYEPATIVYDVIPMPVGTEIPFGCRDPYVSEVPGSAAVSILSPPRKNS